MLYDLRFNGAETGDTNREIAQILVILRIISYDGYFQEQPLSIVHPLNILLLTNVKVTGLTRTRFILTNRRTGYVEIPV